jgi:hypothetical protein
VIARDHAAWNGTVEYGIAGGIRDVTPLRVDHATGDAVLRRALEGRPATPHPHSTVIALALHDDGRAFVAG